MSTASRPAIYVLAIFGLATTLAAQEQTATVVPRSSAVITAATTGDKVRFSAPASVCQMRVQIVSASGEPLFDSPWKDGNVLDWPIESPGQPLASGSYRCVVMVRDLEGQVTRREATLTAQGGRVSIEPRGGSEGLTVLGSDESGPKITMLAHDGTSGAIVSTSGDLSFRFGQFLADKDSERMRLTAEGNLGIGTDKPQAPLDVNGLIRTSKGIMFPDGTILTTAAGPGVTVDDGGPTRERPAGPIIVRGGVAPGSQPPSITTNRLTPRSAVADYQFKVDSLGVHIGTTSAFGLDVAGNVTLSSNLALPATSSATAGVITLGGSPFAHSFGSNNTFVGANAGNFTTSGSGGNTAVGGSALSSNTTGFNNTASGTNALPSNTAGNQNTANGFAALEFNTTGNTNTATGAAALQSNTTGSDNTANGGFALFQNTTGTTNTASGKSALENNTTGNDNTASGSFALYSNTTGTTNTASGKSALRSNTTGNDNTASGGFALYSNTIGSNNAASGSHALQSNTSGSQNTGSGFAALQLNTTGASNTATGAAALQNNSTGSDNTAGSAFALFTNTTGYSNTASGYFALFSNNTGFDNAASGALALQNNTTGAGNTACGGGALSANTTGNSNIGLGINGGSLLTTGSSNIDIGNRGVAADSATIRIGTQGTQTKTFLAGVRGFTTLVGGITVIVDANGQLGTVSSSRRFKFDINDMGLATDNLMRLRPVTFRYIGHGVNGPLQYGLIAEEVAEVYPELVARDRDGQIEAVTYQSLAPMLLNELQKQYRQNEQRDRRADEQQKMIDGLQKRLAALEQRAGATK